MKPFFLALPALAAALPASENLGHTKTTSAAPAYASIKSVAYGGTGKFDPYFGEPANR
jgi:hypothetical protein